MHTTPTSSWNCCRARAIETDCPTASASGRPASRKPTPRRHVQRGTDLRSVGMRQIVAGQGGTAAAAVRRGDRHLRRGDRRRRPRRDCSSGLRKRCPALPATLGLERNAGGSSPGTGHPAGKKVLIVLDQFEQWLHAKKEEQNAELVQALRQCDGGRVQCIVMVRDDFWMAVSRFMRELEIRLVEGAELGGWSISSTATMPRGCWRRSAGPSADFPRTPAISSKEQKHSSNKPSPAWPRKARSSACGWPCLPR